MAREFSYPAGVHQAFTALAVAADAAGDIDDALDLARQAGQVTGDIPGWIARNWNCIMTALLANAGDLAAAETTSAEGLARSREAGDLWALSELLNFLAEVDLQAHRPHDAAAHLHEALQIATRTGGGFELVNWHSGAPRYTRPSTP